MVLSNSLGQKIHSVGWIAGIAASLCVMVYNNPNAPRVASGVKHNMINFVTTNILGVTQQPHDVIHLNGIPVITNLATQFFSKKIDPSFALQAKCSAAVIAKTKDAVVVLAAAHCPPTGNQVRTAHGQGLGPVEKVFSTTSSQDLVLAVIAAPPKVLSTITPIPLATPEESRGILLQTTQHEMNVMAVGYPQMNPFVSNNPMNRTLGGDRHPVAIVAPLVRVGEGEKSSSVLKVGLLSTATGFSGGPLVGLSGNDLRIVGVITDQKPVKVIKGNQEIKVHLLSPNTFPTTETAICVQDNGGENVSLSLEEVVKKIASLTPCRER
jgi:hypothetical protein